MTKEEKAKLLEEGKTEVEITQLETIANLKLKMDSMIDPVKFAELQAEYDELMRIYTTERPAPKVVIPVTLRKASVIANELRAIKDGDMTNRDYIKLSLEYRKAYMSELGKDPWTDFSVTGSAEATDKTQNIADALQSLVDENPSNVEFRMKLESVLRDDPKVIAVLRTRKAIKDKQKK